MTNGQLSKKPLPYYVKNCFYIYQGMPAVFLITKKNSGYTREEVVEEVEEKKEEKKEEEEEEKNEDGCKYGIVSPLNDCMIWRK